MPNILELVMIVKDAQHVISNTLQAIKPFIDHWTILDTGSLDKTKEIIEKELKDIPGNLYSENFIDFATSRNRVLDLAGTTCKYTIMLDDSYILYNGETLRNILASHLEKDTREKVVPHSFEIAIQDDKNRLYYSKRILKTDCKLRYKYRVHEIIDDNSPCIAIDYFSTHVYLFDKREYIDEMRSKERLPFYLKILLEDYNKDPNDTRIIYYLATTYFAMENYEEAEKFFRLRISKKENLEEVYISQYFIGFIKENKEEKILEFLKAHEIDNRAEPLFQIAVIYYRENNNYKAFQYLQKAYLYRIPKRILQVDINIYLEEIPTLYADVALQLDKKDLAKQIINKAISNFSPENIPTKIKNIYATLFSDNENIIVKKSNKPLIVIHTGTWWNPINMDKTSGSEIMAINIAKELIKRNYRVVLFLNMNEFLKENEIILDGIEYKHEKLYKQFIENYYIDVLIVSRNVDNLIYKEGTQKVYLWLHDLIPQGGVFQTHRTKFKSVLCLSDWHANYFCKEYAFPKEMVKVTRNAIDISRFNTPIIKEPFRFIYSSDPKRGLESLLNMFPKIRALYPLANLQLFVKVDDIPAKLLSKLRKKDGIYLRGKVSQLEIANEYKKSDIWLYPTTWQETYCITALEAQISRVLCASYKIGSLTEIISNRGILADNENDLLKKLLFVMERPEIKNTLLDKAEKWAKEQTIEKLIDEWQKDIL